MWPCRRSVAFACLFATLIAAPAARALDQVQIGTTLSITDLPFFISSSRGYFRDEDIEVNFVSFDSAARMIAPLASGDLDGAAGGPSAGLYNAIGRNIGVR
jgi:NitT/TauT family transport system substrate-binding protein